MQSRQNVFLWVLYDFANSFVQITFFLYFAQWLVIDSGVSDLHFNLTFTAAALLLLCTAPFVGIRLDAGLRRIVGLRLTTAGVVLFYSLCALSAVFGLITPAIICFTLGLYSYLLSFTFYTPLLNDIAEKTKRGFVSGLGILGHYSGQCLGLILALPFSLGVWSLWGSEVRAETLLPAVGAFLLFALPMLLWFKDEPKPSRGDVIAHTFGQVISETKILLRQAPLCLFLLAFFFMTDAVLTASNNFPIFLEQVWQVSDLTKTYIVLGIIITSGIGGVLSGVIADRVGHVRTLLFVVLGWVVLLPLLALVEDFALFVGLTILLGFWFGAHFTVSRSVMSVLAPERGYHLAFSYFSLIERMSSFVGPVVWGLALTTVFAGSADPYRYTLGLLVVFVLLALACLLRLQKQLRG